jgi:lysophospholipase L1-like esterase
MWNDIWYSSVKNWHPDILIYQKPPALLTWLLEHSRLVHLVVMGTPSKEKLTDIENPLALQKYAENLQAMIKLAQQYHIKLAFVEPPIDADHMPEQGLNEFQIRYSKAFFIEQAKQYRHTMQAIASDAKRPVLNHSLSLDNLHQKSLFLDLLHPTEEGNAIMARNIYTPLIKYIHSNKSN